jgi:hypothetical protein
MYELVYLAPNHAQFLNVAQCIERKLAHDARCTCASACHAVVTRIVANAAGAGSQTASGDGSGAMSGRDVNQGMLLCRTDARAAAADAVRVVDMCAHM